MSRTPLATQPTLLQREHHFTRCAFGRRIDRRNFAANHHLDQRRLIHRVHGIRADAFAIARTVTRSGKREDFLEPVRDVDDANIMRAQVTHDGEKEVLLLLR
jgi:hypothetical protein